MLKRKNFYKLMTFWPPLMGAGVKIEKVSEDIREITVSMKLRFWNKNYVNTHYGGSLYSMTDPFYMLMLMENLGRNYIVWDKSATIKFKRPGKGKVHATFKIDEATLSEIKNHLATNEKMDKVFNVEVLNEQNELVCSVEKILHISNKKTMDPVIAKKSMA